MSTAMLNVQTTGLPTRYFKAHPPSPAPDTGPRIVRVSVLIETPEGATSLYDYIVKLDGFPITNSEYHGITNDISQTRGVPFPDVARLLLGHLEGVSKLVMHNAYFCMSMLKDEMLRIGMPIYTFPESVCTMQLGKSLPKLPGAYGDYKYPTFSELYYYLFGKMPVTTGVTALYEVVKKMRELRVL